MATPSKVHLSVENTGAVPYKPQNAQTAKRTSELLQDNHEKYHTFFNHQGFQNHIAHHVLSLYALGASTPVIEAAYRTNSYYQRPQHPVVERVLEDMVHPESFKKYLGNDKYYQDFLVFWQKEMEVKGWENVLNEYLFAKTEQSDDLLGRMFSGLLHPMIHLGFGIDFQQPAIIAEALAQGAVHDSWTGDFLLEAEKRQKPADSPDQRSLPELIEAVQADKKLSTAARYEDVNKIRDGIIKRAPEEMLEYLSRWTVTDDDDLEEKTAEMINAVIWFTAGAQNPPKQVKFDFFYMHSVNATVFWPTFNAQSWLSPASKARLLQWKVYIDLTLYASRGAPKPLTSEITEYIPAGDSDYAASWSGIFDRLFKYTSDGRDDGHAVKLGRAVRNGLIVSKRWEDEGKDWVRVKGDMWDKIGNMTIDSMEDTGAAWARNVGFKEAWVSYGDRKKTGASAKHAAL